MTVLERRCPADGFAVAIANYIGGQIDLTQQALGDSTFTGRHIECLKSLQSLIASLSSEDPRIYGMYIAQTRGGGDSDHFTPGESQSTFIARAGVGGPTDALPDAGDLLNEFVSLGFEDCCDRMAAMAGTLGGEAARDHQRTLDELSERTKTAEAESESLTAELTQRDAEIEGLNAQIESLRRLVPENGTEPKKTKKTKAVTGGSR